jgi:hypothetical protein
MALPEWIDHNRNISLQQFNPSQVGPAEAKSQQIREPNMEGFHPGQPPRVGDQQQLFSTRGHGFMLEPHQQTRAQFAADPRTWWHGRHNENLPTKAGAARNAGIHFGTLAAAHQRKQKLGPSHKLVGSKNVPVHAQPYRFFPVRMTGAPSNTPREAGHDEGARWEETPGIHYYQNDVEDRGSISAKVPSRKDVSTHGDLIKQAGKRVHPMIAWEHQQLGRRQYDPETKSGEQVRDERAEAHGNERVLQPHLFDMNKISLGAADRRRDLLEGAGMMTDSLGSDNKMQRSPKTQEASMYLRYGHPG